MLLDSGAICAKIMIPLLKTRYRTKSLFLVKYRSKTLPTNDLNLFPTARGRGKGLRKPALFSLAPRLPLCHNGSATCFYCFLTWFVGRFGWKHFLLQELQLLFKPLWSGFRLCIKIILFHKRAHCYRTLLQETATGHCYRALLQDTVTGHLFSKTYGITHNYPLRSTSKIWW